MLFALVILLLFLAYACLLLYYSYQWKQLPVYTSKPVNAGTRVSVIIPVRNEAACIGRLLDCLIRQDYPSHLYEVIVVNDHSTDDTVNIVQSYTQVKLLHLEADAINSYKKKAVETGIQAASGQLIVTTDGDCYMGEQWLSTLVHFYEEKKPVYIAAPVAMRYDSRLLPVFQAYDFAVLQGITAVSVYRQLLNMSNGANQAYSKEAFDSVNGFRNIDHIASGDDMLLMQKMVQRYPNRIGYLLSADALVHTEPAAGWRAFLQQRIRWASKAGHYMDNKIKAVLLLVYLFNLCFPVLLIAGFWNRHWWLAAALLWLAKTLVEWPFVAGISRFFGMQSLLKYFFFLQPLHIIYTLTAGLLGQKGSYEWKGRTVK